MKVPTRRSGRIKAQVHSPKINKIIKASCKPPTPLHPGEAMRSKYCSEWLEALFSCFEKMHNTATLSRPFLRKLLPKRTMILSPRLSYEVRTTELDNFFEFKIRLLLL